MAQAAPSTKLCGAHNCNATRTRLWHRLLLRVLIPPSSGDAPPLPLQFRVTRDCILFALRFFAGAKTSRSALSALFVVPFAGLLLLLPPLDALSSINRQMMISNGRRRMNIECVRMCLSTNKHDYDCLDSTFGLFPLCRARCGSKTPFDRISMAISLPPQHCWYDSDAGEKVER